MKLVFIMLSKPVTFEFFCRFGYFGQKKNAQIRLFLCSVSGCLTNGQIFVSVSGQEFVAINGQDLTGIRMLKEEDIEVEL